MLGVQGAPGLQQSLWWPVQKVASHHCLAHRLCFTQHADTEDLGHTRYRTSKALFAAAAVAVWAQKRIRHLRAVKEEQCSEKVHLPYDASEEELLSYDLADEDFSLCEEEEEEWRQYDEEVTQFKKLVLECGSDPMSSSSRSAFANCGLTQTHDSPDADLRGLLDGPCHEALLPNESREALDGQSKPLSFDTEKLNGHFELPGEYRRRLEESNGTGVVVTARSGDNALVLLSHVPDQPQLLPVVSDTFGVQGVKLLRGWMETMDNGVVIGAFEVSDLNGQPLSTERAEALERALMQAGKEHVSNGKVLKG